MVTCDNFRQSRIQCLVYLLQMINSGFQIVQKLISDAAPKGLIFELSALHGYGYCQTYVLLIFLARKILAL